MAWYSTGTATFTNSSGTVTGAGTAWVANVQPGDAIHAPDGKVYEVTGVVSDTSLTIDPAYQATTAAGAAYRIQPTRGWMAEVLAQVAALVASYQAGVDGALAGKFPDGVAATPAMRFVADQDTGFFRKASGEVGFASNGVERGYFGATGLMGDWVQASQLDVTANRLMKVGAFGLGGLAPRLDNWDATDNSIAPGFYTYDPPAGSVGGPSAVSRAIGFHLRRASGGGECQFLIVESTSDSSQALSGDIFSRRRVTGAWGTWYRGFTADRVIKATVAAPVVTAQTGTITDAIGSYTYTKIDDAVIVSGSVTINDAGTGAGLLYVGMPYSPTVPTAASAVGFIGVTDAKARFVGTNLEVALPSGNTIIATGRVIQFGGIYHAA